MYVKVEHNHITCKEEEGWNCFLMLNKRNLIRPARLFHSLIINPAKAMGIVAIHFVPLWIGFHIISDMVDHLSASGHKLTVTNEFRCSWKLASLIANFV